jgi:hypothetical protein
MLNIAYITYCFARNYSPLFLVDIYHFEWYLCCCFSYPGVDWIEFQNAFNENTIFLILDWFPVMHYNELFLYIGVFYYIIYKNN